MAPSEFERLSTFSLDQREQREAKSPPVGMHNLGITLYMVPFCWWTAQRRDYPTILPRILLSLKGNISVRSWRAPGSLPC